MFSPSEPEPTSSTSASVPSVNFCRLAKNSSHVTNPDPSASSSSKSFVSVCECANASDCRKTARSSEIEIASLPSRSSASKHSRSSRVATTLSFDSACGAARPCF